MRIRHTAASAVPSAIRRPPSALACRPLLKWAGGKRQLLPQLRRFYPTDFTRYIEPFFGSGAVFFDLHAAGLLRDRDVLLIDSNPDLIGCYETVQARPHEVADELERLAAAHSQGGQAHYYSVRDEQFNPIRAHLRAADGGIAYTPALAAMLIYLNRTGFNGLFRVNTRGVFNVPAGRYERPRIADREKLLRVAAALSAPGVRLLRGSYEMTREVAGPDDFIYCDPPYAPLTATANFTAYTAACFSAADQRRLQQMLIALSARGCQLLISNSSADQIVRLYDEDVEAQRAGLKVFRLWARRAVNSRPEGRGPVVELLITNIAPR